MITRKEIKEKRKYLEKLADKKVRFGKGDRRVFTPRLCVVCGRPLSSLVINENKYVTIQPHTRYHIRGITMDTCTDIGSCYRTLIRNGELNEDVNG